MTLGHFLLPARLVLGSPLPGADVLLVTWTVDEGHALSPVSTPGKDSHNDYLPCTHNYAAISAKMRAGFPAREAKRLGTFWTTMIGWRQIIDEVRPTLVITTGTAGGSAPERVGSIARAGG